MNIIKWIRYNTPLKYITYNKLIYNGNSLKIKYAYCRERCFMFGFKYNGPYFNEYNDTVYWNDTEYFVNHFKIFFIWFEIDFIIKRKLYNKNC